MAGPVKQEHREHAVRDLGEPEVLVREGHLLVANKPAGLRSSQEHSGDRDSVEGRLAAAEGHRLWAVHQLDRETSGLLLFVDRGGEVERWQKRLKAGSKRYLALCSGDLAAARPFVVEEPLAKRPDGSVVIDPQGKPATTTVEIIARSSRLAGGACLVLCRPKTGRTHQVRVHLAHLGLPVIGDARYAPRTVAQLAPRHMLHLRELRLAGRHFVAEPPDDFAKLAAELELPIPSVPEGVPGN